MIEKLISHHWWLSLLDRILRRPNIANGFRYEEPKIQDWKVMLGAEDKVYNESKNWKKYRSTGERQKRDKSSETMACVTYGTHNVMEQKMNLMKAIRDEGNADYETTELVKIFEHFGLYDEKGEANLSDTFTAKLSGTSWRGNTLSNVLSSVRNNGVVAESVWKTPEQYTWEEYYKKIPQDVIDRGKKLLEFVEITHKWVYPQNFNDIKTFCPVITTVAAGSNWNNDSIKPATNARHNHCVDNDYFEQGKFDGIFDSYLPFEKKVTWKYGLGTGKVVDFKLLKKLESFNTEAIDKLADDGKQYVMRAEGLGQIYELKDNKLVTLDTKSKLDGFVLAMAKSGKLIGITEAKYNELTNQA